MTPLPELAELRRAVYVGGKKVLSDDYLKQLTPLSLAVWYMDDGSFTIRAKGLQERTKDGSGRSEICVEAMEPTTRTRLVAYLADTWGINAKLVSSGARKKAVLVFAKDETAKLHALVAPSSTRRCSTSCSRGTGAGSPSSRCSRRCATS